jgi:predicted transcriptional regulator
MIKSVHGTLGGLVGASQGELPTAQKPAVPIKRSVTPDYIVCLEDGKKLKMLKRYLRSNYNMTPEEYRAKWGLPADYPMVAPNYAAQRSEFAKKIGLGRTASSPGAGAKACAGYCASPAFFRTYLVCTAAASRMPVVGVCGTRDRYFGSSPNRWLQPSQRFLRSRSR